MSRATSDPRLVFSIDNIRAFHLQNGEETDLTPSSPQTLSLLMVPTTLPPPDPANPESVASPAGQGQEEDFYLHLHLPPEVDLPLPATTQIYHQPPDSYLIPRWDLGGNGGTFIRIQFPSIGAGTDQVTQEDVDTFETILAQCTAFLERSPPPKYHAPYIPATYAPGEGYVGIGPETSQDSKAGKIVLVDEGDGSVVGELTAGFNVVESLDVKPGSKNPVHVELPQDGQGNQINVSNVSPEYLQLSRHPAYAKSSIVQTSAMASRLLVTGSMYVAKGLHSGVDTFAKKTKPVANPLTFTPTTQDRIRKINNFSQSAAGLSAKTVGQIGKYAQNFGASIARRGEKDYKTKGFDKEGKPVYDYKPGILNKSLIAFSTLVDGIDQSARTLLESGSTAAASIVSHRYGAEAGTAATNIAGGFRNVGLVYIDAAGVSRKAILKSVAKGMVVGRMHDGQHLVVGGGDGGELPSTTSMSRLAAGSPGPAYPRRSTPSPTPPPPYGTKNDRSLGGTPMQNEKR